MGELIAGQWRRGGVEKLLEDGRLRRPPAVFRNWIGLTETDKAPAFPAEAGRYHLYVSLACPWAHRTLIMRRLKGLEELVGLSVAHWLMGEDGWSFQPGPGVIPDTVNGVQWLHQLYTLSEPDCSSRVTVPVLWDKDSRKVVSNESAEILRMFNSAFDRIGAAEGDYYPAELRSEIDAHDAGAVRCGLLRPLQMQFAGAGRLSRSLALHAGALPAPGDPPDRRFRSHQGPLL